MNVKFDFTGQVVVITGSASGLGKATAVEFAKAGANIAVCDMNQQAGEKTVKELKTLGIRAIFCKMNITDEQEVSKAKKDIIKEFGTVDILVNAAATINAKGKMGPPMAKVDVEEWRRLFDINLIGIVIVTKAFGDIFKNNKKGKIVNFASQAAYGPQVVMPHYTASKIAVISYTQSCSIEFGAYNVNVNAVCPGFIMTEMTYHSAALMKETMPQRFANCETVEDMVKLMVSTTSLKRYQKPEDIAYGIMFLASDIASEITGQALIIDSGGIRR